MAQVGLSLQKLLSIAFFPFQHVHKPILDDAQRINVNAFVLVLYSSSLQNSSFESDFSCRMRIMSFPFSVSRLNLLFRPRSLWYVHILTRASLKALLSEFSHRMREAGLEEVWPSHHRRPLSLSFSPSISIPPSSNIDARYKQCIAWIHSEERAFFVTDNHKDVRRGLRLIFSHHHYYH